MKSLTILKGDDCTDLFKQAYENRYTWGENFLGFKGNCSLEYKDYFYEGKFSVSKDLKVIVEGVSEEETKKEIQSQLWEVGIHRIRRTFESVHGENTFTAGDCNELGQEVLVGGKNKGDKYRVKDNIVTMVYRHIHGKLIRIYTVETIDTGMGYLSKVYNSQYLDCKTNKTESRISYFEDQFIPLRKNGPWVLAKRLITLNDIDNNNLTNKIFSFNNLDVF